MLPRAATRRLEIIADYKLGIWDYVVLAIASQLRCRLLLSEDMQDGFYLGGVTVTNPFPSIKATYAAS